MSRALGVEGLGFSRVYPQAPTRVLGFLIEGFGFCAKARDLSNYHGPRAWRSIWISLSIKIAQKPYIIGSLGPKALKYESLDGKGMSAFELTPV